MQQQHQAAEQMSRMHSQIRALVQQWQIWREERERLQVYDAANGSGRMDKETALWILQNRRRKSVGHDSTSTTDAKATAGFEAWRGQSESE
jgi:hypothetical protein